MLVDDRARPIRPADRSLSELLAVGFLNRSKLSSAVQGHWFRSIRRMCIDSLVRDRFWIEFLTRRVPDCPPRLTIDRLITGQVFRFSIYKFYFKDTLK